MSPDPDARAGPRSTARLVVMSVVVFGALCALGVVAAQVFGAEDDGPAARVDEFSEASVEGLPAGVLSWESVTGAFASKDGVAAVATQNDAGPRTITVADVGATNVTIDVTAGELRNGWGVVFRYAGPLNYWYLQAVPDYALFNVVRVAGGKAEVAGVTKTLEMRDGLSMQIRLEGPAIEVRHEGKTVFLASDDHALGALRAGLVASGENAGTWESFSVEVSERGPGTRTVTIRDALDAGDGDDDAEPAPTTVPDPLVPDPPTPAVDAAPG